MHFEKSAALAALALALVAGCDPSGSQKQYQYYRSLSSPETLTFQNVVDVDRSECESHTVYGPDSSCGSYETCNKDSRDDMRDDARSHAHDDARDHARDEHGYHSGNDGGGGSSGGGDSWGGGGSSYTPPAPVCTTNYNSCDHTETSCYPVFDHKTRVTVRIHFDPKAELLPGELERFDFSLEGSGSTQYVKLDIQQGRYVYDYPRETRLDLSGERAEATIEIKLQSSAAQKPANNLKILKAGYVNDGEFQVEFKDPYFRVRSIAETRYSFLVMRFLRTYLRATVSSKDVTQREDGTLVASIKSGDAAWRHAPKKAQDVPYEFSYWLERQSPLFKAGWSDEKFANFRR